MLFLIWCSLPLKYQKLSFKHSFLSSLEIQFPRAPCQNVVWVFYFDFSCIIDQYLWNFFLMNPEVAVKLQHFNLNLCFCVYVCFLICFNLKKKKRVVSVLEDSVVAGVI